MAAGSDEEAARDVRMLLQADVRYEGCRASSLVTSAGVRRRTLKI